MYILGTSMNTRVGFKQIPTIFTSPSDFLFESCLASFASIIDICWKTDWKFSESSSCAPDS